MIASTCLAVLFVPSFYAVLQSYEEWRTRKKKPKATPAPAEPGPPAAAEQGVVTGA